MHKKHSLKLFLTVAGLEKVCFKNNYNFHRNSMPPPRGFCAKKIALPLLFFLWGRLLEGGLAIAKMREGGR